MQLKKYVSLDDMVNDFLLMFDNACKFNEPDSLIYKVGLLQPKLFCQYVNTCFQVWECSI